MKRKLSVLILLTLISILFIGCNDLSTANSTVATTVSTTLITTTQTTIEEPTITQASTTTGELTTQAATNENVSVITYMSNGGSSVESLTQIIGALIESPEDPTKEGWTFVGWYSDAALLTSYIFDIMPVEDITLYAKWTINQYGITYIIETNGNELGFMLHQEETITQISLGGAHSSAITSEGRLFTWGKNDYGQLGDGTTTDCYIPTDITSWFNLVEGETITKITLRFWHSAALTSDGRIFTWGSNSDGELGDGTTTDRYIPTEITSQFNLNEEETITEITLGGYHSSAITTEGRVFTWGWNRYGQLGDGTTTSRITPTEITSQFNLSVGETITKIALGNYSSSAITTDGRVFTWGDNTEGQLGDGTTTVRYIPTEITSQFNLSVGETITQIILGGFHSSAITSEDRVFTWGRNNSGQLGDGTTTSRYIPTEITSQFNLNEEEIIRTIYLNGSHSSAITSEDRVFMWGWNAYGQLGDGTMTNRYIPTEVTSQFNFSEEETITQISLGACHSLAITSKGGVFTWGWNEYGQLGDGTTTNQYNLKLLSIYTIINVEIYDFDEDTSEYIPAMTGYTFSGWYSDQELTIPYIFTTMPSEDITLYGKWNIIT